MSQVLQDTIAARDLLASGGWIPERLRDRETGSHCAVGAILDTVMADGVSGGPLANGFNFFFDPRHHRVAAVLKELVQSIPDVSPTGIWTDWLAVVDYNNSMGEQVVMDMFNATIARLTAIEAPIEQIEQSVSP